MCGIFGWCSTLDKSTQVVNTQRAVALTVLALLNEERGGHSAGVYDADRNRLDRWVGSALQIPAAQYRTARRLLGHTRFATTGAVNVVNAHPLRCGGVVGMHNGVLYNHRELNTKHGRACEVDSEHLFYHLDAGLPLDDIQGYGAIAYTRDGDNAVYIGRWGSGVLSVATTPWGVVFSSDKRHLEAALDMAGVKGYILEVTPGVLYTLRGGRVVRSETGILPASTLGGSGGPVRHNRWDPQDDDITPEEDEILAQFRFEPSIERLRSANLRDPEDRVYRYEDDDTFAAVQPLLDYVPTSPPFPGKEDGEVLAGANGATWVWDNDEEVWNDVTTEVAP